MANGKPGRFFRRLIFLAVLSGAVFLWMAIFRVGPEPVVSIEAGLPGIGKRTPFSVTVSEPKRGLSDVRVEFVQGERVELIAARSYAPLPPWAFWGDKTESDELELVAGSETLDKLKEGPAKLRVVAERAPTWLRFPEPVVHELELPVKLRPPVLQVLSTLTFLTQGGSEAVVYRVGETAVDDGVQAGDWWFPGHPLPGGEPGRRFALFGAPYDLDHSDAIRIVARDDVGNEARTAFVDRFTARPPKHDTIRLSDGFLTRVVPPIMARTPELEDRGTPLDNYLAINGELRKRNNDTLIRLAQRSEKAFLWSRPFLQMRNSKVMSDFADRRTYLYEGRGAVDHQDHLGFDLASVRNAEIQAANDGVVVLSRFFGIYGNAVVIDHGYGLMSLYGHLSSLALEEGARVERGQAIGRSGSTGLAGGDHLHFTMMLYGLPVNPREWWDRHWIEDRLVLKLGPALPFKP